MAYRIRDWEERYEVNDKNRALKAGEKMRQGSLEYLRFPVHGRDHSAAYRRFLREAKDDAPAVYGVYVKLKEIAAQAEAGKRGVIRNDSGVAIEAEEIADCMGFPVKIVAKSLDILCRAGVGWVEQFREFPEIPGNSPSETETESYTETETESVDSSALPGTEDAKPDDPALLTFKCNGTPDFWEFRESLKLELETAYPGIDIVAQARAAYAWVLTNRPKTARGMPKFLNAWIARTNDSIRAKPNGLSQIARDKGHVEYRPVVEDESNPFYIPSIAGLEPEEAERIGAEREAAKAAEGATV